ncbi:MAG TPA: efflux RND transporter periplasmic adaptor subunit [Hanamia sp.]|nr:efflux RND transporter periplasmic adaptor subunit [Hanamia sp.]
MKRLGYLIVFFFLLPRCNQKVETTRPSVEKISELVYASGVIKSKDQYEVYASANGVVTSLLAHEGDLVKKGQELMVLDNRIAKLNIESAGLLAENASVAQNAEKLRELKNAIDLAKEKLDYDSSLLARQQNLWKSDIGTRNDLERQELAYKNSLKAYNTALLNYTDFKKQLQLQDQQARKNVSISKSVAANYSVKSEMDGKVYDVLVEEGEMVTPQLPVAIIGNADDFVLELNVDEYDISRIRIGQEILVNMDSYKSEVFTAKVTRINPLMNNRTKTFVVEALFVKRPEVLYANLSCEANIIIRSNEKAITIPRSYLLPGDYVLLQNDKKKKIVTGLKDYQKVEVVKGLNPIDVIQKPKE